MHTFANLHPTVFPPTSAAARAALAGMIRALFTRPSTPSHPPLAHRDNEIAGAALRAAALTALGRP